MTRGGFVLAGGASRRMGQDKALLPLGTGTMVEQIALVVRKAAGNVTILDRSNATLTCAFPLYPTKSKIADPSAVFTLPFPSRSRLERSRRLRHAARDPEFLIQLFEAAETADADCLVPKPPENPIPCVPSTTAEWPCRGIRDST